MSLTQQRIDFIANYLIDFNPEDAARRAGYKNPGKAGRRLLRNTEVLAEIQDTLKSEHMGSIEALARAAKLARNGNTDALRLIFEHHGLNYGPDKEA